MRRVRRNHQKLWMTLFACLGVLGALGAAQTCGLFNARDTYLAQTLAYADEIADPSRQAADEVEVTIRRRVSIRGNASIYRRSIGKTTWLMPSSRTDAVRV